MGNLSQRLIHPPFCTRLLNSLHGWCRLRICQIYHPLLVLRVPDISNLSITFHLSFEEILIWWLNDINFILNCEIAHENCKEA